MGGFVALVIIGVSGTHNQTVSAPNPPDTAPSPPPLPPAPAPSPAQISQVSPQPQPTVELNDITHFPATIILKQRLDVKTDSGGFGLNAGEEVVVLRKQNGTYIIQHQNKEYPINADILDTIMQSK